MICSLIRFKQAGERLNVMRAINNAPNKLLSRLVRRFEFVNLRDGTNNYRVYDIARHPTPPPLQQGHTRSGSHQTRATKVRDAMRFAGVRDERQS